MQFDLDGFVAILSMEDLNSLKTSEIVEIAKLFDIHVSEHLIDESILPSTELKAGFTVPSDNSFELRRLEFEMQKGIKEIDSER